MKIRVNGGQGRFWTRLLRAYSPAFIVTEKVTGAWRDRNLQSRGEPEAQITR